MAAPRLSDDLARQALMALRDHPNKVAAAQALGIPINTFRSRIERARAMFPEPEPAAFEVPELPDETPTAEELIARRIKQFQRKSDAKDARKLVPVKVKIDGPFGLALFGDPHVDDDGTDIALLQRHVDMVNRTEGLFGANVGDYSNNWVGRLARLYGEQSVSAAESWVLVEWLITAVPWMFLIGGNHDCWSGAGDPVKWMARSARVSYEAHGMRLGLETPTGRVIRVNARHDFSGKSQWNTAHGPSKAAQMGWRDHLLVCGHTHQSGYQIVRDPASGLLSHALRVGSYKTFDRYADEKGLPNQTVSPCVVVIVQPTRNDDDPGLITVFHDVEMGADVLKFLRKRKA